MTGGAGLARREFLVAAGAGVLGLATAGLSGLAACQRRDALAAALADFYRDRESAARVGRRYLAEAPQDGTLDAAVAALVGSRRAEYAALAETDPAALAERLRAQHRDDFAAGRVVSVEGWVLSATEARLCAIAALSGR